MSRSSRLPVREQPWTHCRQRAAADLHHPRFRFVPGSGPPHEVTLTPMNPRHRNPLSTTNGAAFTYWAPAAALRSTTGPQCSILTPPSERPFSLPPDEEFAEKTDTLGRNGRMRPKQIGKGRWRSSATQRKSNVRVMSAQEQARQVRLRRPGGRTEKPRACGKKLGKHNVPESNVIVQIGEDLNESLTGLTVCNFVCNFLVDVDVSHSLKAINIFRDYFQSLPLRLS